MTKTRTRIAVLTIALCAALAAGLPETGPRADAEKARVCTACGQVIRESYFETGGKFYHSRCFTCEYCKKPIDGAFTVYRGKNYHTPCFDDRVALRCAVCGGIVQGQYLLDYWGNAYHPRHKDDVLQCDFCQRFIVGGLADGMKRLHDGRSLCAKCAPSSVTNIREARSILVDAAEKLRSVGVGVDPGSIQLSLVGEEELARIADSRSNDTRGFTEYWVNKSLFGKVTAETVKIYLLFGMPRVQMASTAAHELMHVWQFRKGRLDQDAAVSEGSCNFASYLVLRKLGEPEAEFVIDGMLRDPDPVYGEGFRRVKAYTEEKGVAPWLRLLKEKNPDLTLE
ncbi:MAG: hypothetical protein H6Q78_1193 [Candidatus Krumholzibacteriota bacterium]|nr:hypothetical protein [Candidatus Krumholzibacteriota bacterium]